MANIEGPFTVKGEHIEDEIIEGDATCGHEETKEESSSATYGDKTHKHECDSYDTELDSLQSLDGKRKKVVWKRLNDPQHWWKILNEETRGG